MDFVRYAVKVANTKNMFLLLTFLCVCGIMGGNEAVVIFLLPPLKI